MVLLLILLIITQLIQLNFLKKGQAGEHVTKNVKIMIPSKYWRKFWRILKKSLVNCEITF